MSLIKLAKRVHCNMVLAKDNRKFRKKSRMETFRNIYAEKLWGGGEWRTILFRNRVICRRICCALL